MRHGMGGDGYAQEQRFGLPSRNADRRLEFFETWGNHKFQLPAILRAEQFLNSLPTAAANSRTMPKALFNPTCAWLTLASIFQITQ